MSGQATGKRQHLPFRMRMYYQPGAGVALLFNARIGGFSVATLEELRQKWRPGVQLYATVAVAEGSPMQKLVVGLSGTGTTVEVSQQSSTWIRVHQTHTSIQVSGFQILESKPLPPTAGDLALVASTGEPMAWPQLHQICTRNDTIKSGQRPSGLRLPSPPLQRSSRGRP